MQFIVSFSLGSLGLLWYLWKWSSAHVYARGRKQCCKLYYCLWRVSIKPRLPFSICNVNFVSKGNLFRHLLSPKQFNCWPFHGSIYIISVAVSSNIVNPLKTDKNTLPHHILEEPIFHFRSVRLYDVDIPKEKRKKMIELFANSGAPDQISHSAASDLGLHYLPATRLGVSSLQWVNSSSLLFSVTWEGCASWLCSLFWITSFLCFTLFTLAMLNKLRCYAHF